MIIQRTREETALVSVITAASKQELKRLLTNDNFTVPDEVLTAASTLIAMITLNRARDHLDTDNLDITKEVIPLLEAWSGSWIQ
jgi:hypothetical protein